MKTRGLRAALAAAGLALLTGCGGIHPGAAASVGDTVISRDALADTAEGSCLASTALGAPARLNSQVLGEALTAMVQTELAMQFGESRGVTYDRQVINQLMAQFDAGIPREERYAAFRDAVRDSRIAQLLLIEVGKDELGAPEGQEPGDDQAYSAGAQAMAQWQEDNDVSVDVDPRYAVAEQDGRNVVGGSVSVPVSPVSRSALNPSSGLAERLPAGQVCASGQQ
ncbi:hypothetical protein GCM10027425_16330 [Alteromonas gracilis]